MSTYVEVHMIRRIPPAPQNDAPTRQYHTLIRPQIVMLDLVEIIHEVLHERDALPARDTVLFR
jgi:hypothetical protein